MPLSVQLQMLIQRIFSCRLKISSSPYLTPSQSSKARKLFNPDTDQIPMKEEGEKKYIFLRCNIMIRTRMRKEIYIPTLST